MNAICGQVHAGLAPHLVGDTQGGSRWRVPLVEVVKFDQIHVEFVAEQTSSLDDEPGQNCHAPGRIRRDHDRYPARCNLSDIECLGR